MNATLIAQKSTFAMATASLLEFPTQGENFVPPIPETIEDTGLSTSTIEQLVLKLLYSRGEMLGRDVSQTLGLKFSLMEECIELLKHHHAIQVKKSLGMGTSTAVLALSETGRGHARDC